MSNAMHWFDNISEAERAAATSRFIEMEAKPGAVLIAEGEAKDSMLFITSGEATVNVGGHVVARLSAGTMLGEIALFTRTERTATVRAATASTVQVLTRRAFLALREAGNAVTHRIEQRAIRQLAGRYRTLTNDVIEASLASQGELKKTHSQPEHRGHPQMMTRERLVSTIAEARAFEDASAEELQPLVEAVVARTFGKRDTLAIEGGDTGPAYLLAAGEIECRAAVGDHAVILATLGPGELFNLVHHVAPTPRHVSYVAKSGVSVLEIPADYIRTLLLADTPAGSALRTAMIRSLSERVHQANAAFSWIKSKVPVAPMPLETPKTTPTAAEMTFNDEDAWFTPTGPDWDTWFDEA